RTCQYQLLTARAGLAAGTLAGAGALLFFGLGGGKPVPFWAVWGRVFAGSLPATPTSTLLCGRGRGGRAWSRQARAVLLALTPSLFAALVLSVFFFAQDQHLWLPGVWMLCYGQAALATAAYAPAPIGWLGRIALLLGTVTLWLGPGWSVLM